MGFSASVSQLIASYESWDRMCEETRVKHKQSVQRSILVMGDDSVAVLALTVSYRPDSYWL